MKYMIFILVLLAGCSYEADRPREVHYDLPEELKNCKVYRVDANGTENPILRVVVCPNATTSTQHNQGNMYGSYKPITINQLENRCYAIEQFTDGMGVLFLDRLYDAKNRKYIEVDYHEVIEIYKKRHEYHPDKLIIYP